MGVVLEGVVIVGVVALAMVWQLRPQQTSTDAKSWWVLPAVLIVVTVRDGGLVDPESPTLSVVLLAASVLAGAATGAAWAWTTRVWTDDSGAYWAQGGAATLGVWAGGALVRVALHGVALLVGVQQGSAATVLALAAALLTRSGVVILRVDGPVALVRAASHGGHGDGHGHGHGLVGEVEGHRGGRGKERAPQ